MFVRVVGFFVLLVALAACPRQTRKTLVPDVPTNGNAVARDRFAEAKAKFLRDGGEASDFKAIVQEYPGDPIVPYAELFAGIASIKERKFDVAQKSLQVAIDADIEGLTTRAELFMGIAVNYLGDGRRALPLLQRGEKAIENDNERTEFLAALAYATADSDRPLAALPVFDALHGRVSAPEKALIVQRTQELVAGADANTLGRLFDSLQDRSGPSIAAVASRLALLADQTGNAAEAQRMRDAAGPARQKVGLPRTITAPPPGSLTPSGGADSGLVGAVVPLGGKQNKVAEAAIAGLGLAAGVSDGRGITAVEVRSAQDASASALAVEELAKANVIAVVGPIDSSSVDAAGSRADSLGVPLLSLSTAAEKNASGRFVFHMVHSGEARSRALAQRALGKGIKRFAILAAENGYGRAMTAAFKTELEKGGGTVVTSITYKPDTKSFAGIAGKLSGDWDGVFVPAQADILGLIAPALAATGKVPKPVGTKKVIGGKPVLLVSTAENLTAAYITDAGRHSEGSLLAPGYYPDDQDPTSKAFLDRFIAAFGRAPGFLEAYAYDAAQLAAAAGASGRSGLAASLASSELAGLTGNIRFDADHRRADAGVIYTVNAESGGVFAIRVAR
jgi:branched-chain amino acid transport system substrate-binding protein